MNNCVNSDNPSEIDAVNLISFNCKNIMRSVDCVRRLCGTADIIALQETWLLPHDLTYLSSIHDDFGCTGTSAVDTSAGLLRGRPFGGVALLWKKTKFPVVTVVKCDSVRLAAIKIELHNNCSVIIFSVYMPTDSRDNLIEFTECLGEITAIIESQNVESVYLLGDFNAHPGELFASELLSFCADQSWSCIDMQLLPAETFTFISEAHGSQRWLDHCVVTEAACRSVISSSVLYDTYWSDHLPILLKCNFDLFKSKINMCSSTRENKIKWGERNIDQIEMYKDSCHSKLRDIDFPNDLTFCADQMCNDTTHRIIINKMYDNIVSILSEAAEYSYIVMKRKGKYVTGWNKYVRGAHERARLYYQVWLANNKPNCGTIYNDMCASRRYFKSRLKWCQNNQQQIRMNIVAEHHTNKNFNKFWKLSNQLNLRPSLPVSVAGTHDPSDIANVFLRHFNVQSPLGPASPTMVDAGAHALELRFTASEIASVIKKMVSGKSPGHDSLSIEHLRYAGVHLPRVLALFFNLCLSHSYLPEKMMHTIVIPVIKNKTGDSSDVANYRPISLATTIAKVLDSLIERQLESHLKLSDAQFGFRSGLSTESAILSLKQTVNYYTARKTPVYACFLDLSKAFDLVSYDKLWDKLQNTSVPREIVSVLRHWYSAQRNQVRWAGTLSDEYKLECGVRQGGLSSPLLFNFYVNELIEELRSTRIGCHIDSVCINNISYADDMVLLSPSICALRELIKICETYANAHGLKYNSTKSELMIFKSGTKHYENVPDIVLNGTSLKRVTKFKYLGHWVTDDLKDSTDIERERRSLSVRCNMLARRFARSTTQVKVTLFKAYCQSFYTCSLWVGYVQRAYSDLRVQYNNAFRMLMGLPRYCSASGMFAEANVDSFATIMRKRCTSTLTRMRTSSNSILSVLTDRWDSPMLERWIRLHAVK